MSELEKYELINGCEDIESLEQAILKLADEDGRVQGRAQSFNASSMASYVEHVVKGNCVANYLTRCYGIRQQALYLREYNKYGNRSLHG